MNDLKTVYLADDDEDDRMLIRQALESISEGLNIIEVGNGEELLALLDQRRDPRDPALILMDMNMPRKTGLEALAQIKSNPGSRHIPVVMISTSSDQQLILKAYDQGINAFITKPVFLLEYEQLAQAINLCFLHNYYPVASRSLLPGNS